MFASIFHCSKLKNYRKQINALKEFWKQINHLEILSDKSKLMNKFKLSLKNNLRNHTI
jgi:hypothetical protein